MRPRERLSTRYWNHAKPRPLFRETRVMRADIYVAANAKRRPWEALFVTDRVARSPRPSRCRLLERCKSRWTSAVLEETRRSSSDESPCARPFIHTHPSIYNREAQRPESRRAVDSPPVGPTYRPRRESAPSARQHHSPNLVLRHPRDTLAGKRRVARFPCLPVRRSGVGPRRAQRAGPPRAPPSIPR